VLLSVSTLCTVLQRARTTSRNVSVPGVCGGEGRNDTRGERLDAEDEKPELAAMYGLGDIVEVVEAACDAVEVMRRGGYPAAEDKPVCDKPEPVCFKGVDVLMAQDIGLACTTAVRVSLSADTSTSSLSIPSSRDRG